MGVSCGLQMLPDSDIDALILDPWLLYGFGPAWSRGDELTPLRSASLDKAWAGIQFLLTGTSTDDRDPLHYLCRGGLAVGFTDQSGEPRVLRPAEVNAYAVALTGITQEELRRRYDYLPMKQHRVYCGDDLEYLLENFNVLKAFVLEAKDAGAGLLIWIE